jgi:hypothetical protein
MEQIRQRFLGAISTQVNKNTVQLVQEHRISATLELKYYVINF